MEFYGWRNDSKDDPNETNRYLFDKSTKSNGVPYHGETYIAIPVRAYRVKYVEYETSNNIIESTIIKLKNLGWKEKKISKKLCLESVLVKSILENYRNNESDVELDGERTNVKPKTGYIFYNYYTGSFFEHYMDDETFKNNNVMLLVSEGQEKIVLRKSIDETKKYTIYKLHNGGIVKEAQRPNQETIANIMYQSDKRYKIGSSHYLNAECIDDGVDLDMIFRCYLPMEDCNFVLEDPIFGSFSKKVWHQINAILKNNQYTNRHLIDRLKRIEKEAAESITENDSDAINRDVGLHVRRMYGDDIVKREKLYRKLVNFERTHFEYERAYENRMQQSDYQIQLNNYLKQSHELLECVFKDAYYKYCDQVDMKIILDGMSQISNRDFLKGIIEELGFALSSQVDKFLKKVTKASLRIIFDSEKEQDAEANFDKKDLTRGNKKKSNSKDNTANKEDGNKDKQGKSDKKKSKKDIDERVNSWLMANIICGHYNKKLPICELPESIPDVISLLQNTLGLRNKATHTDNVVTLSNHSECAHLYSICQTVLSKLLDIELHESELNINIVAEKQIELKVENELNKYSTKDHPLRESIKMVGMAYNTKSGDFYSHCSNMLAKIFMLYFEQMQDDDIEPILQKLPEETDNVQAYINKILEWNEIDCQLTCTVKKEKILQYHNPEYMTLAAIMFADIMLIREAGLFDSVPNFVELLKLSDEVIELRGHSNMAEFENNGAKEQELYNKLLKIYKEYKEIKENEQG